MKDVILIHEGVLMEEEIPADLLNPERFDLRSVQLINEILPLSLALKPKAVILDLTQDEFQNEANLQNFLKSLHAPQMAEHRPLICVLGIIKPQSRNNAVQYYQSGVHALLNFPLKSPDLQRELQDLLGTEFRRLDRKEINLPLTLSQGENTWNVVSQNINLECIVVTGNSLPPLGQNVLLKGPQEPLSNCALWTHCWRKNDDSMVLRFLNPDLTFLESIQNLPKFQPASPPCASSPPEKPSPLEEENLFDSPSNETAAAPSTLPPAIQNPGQLHTLAAKELTPYVQSWLRGEQSAPTEVQSVLDKLPEFEKSAFLQEPTPENSKFLGLAEIITLKIFLEVQLNGLLTGVANASDSGNQIVSAHEKAVDTSSKELQRFMVEALSQANNVFAETLNKLKSELQKNMVSLRQTWNVKGKIATLKTAKDTGMNIPAAPVTFPASSETIEDPHGPTRYKDSGPIPKKGTPKKSTKGKEYLQQALAVLLILIIAGVFVAINYWQLTAPQRKISPISETDVQNLSPYFDSGKQSKEKGVSGMRIKMKDDWQSLSEDRKNQEIMGVEAKLKMMNVETAEIVGSDGLPMATYADGQLTFFSKSNR